MVFHTNQDQQERWKQGIEHWECVTDRLGNPIDPGILEAVVALNLLSIQTTASCEGHLDSGHCYPWIDIGYYDEDQEIADDLKQWMALQDQASVMRKATGIEDHDLRSSARLSAASNELEPMWAVLREAAK